MRRTLMLAVAILFLLCSGEGVAQARVVSFRARVEKIEPSMFGGQVIVRVVSISGPKRDASLYLRSEEGQFFGYDDEVIVEVTHTGRKAN